MTGFFFRGVFCFHQSLDAFALLALLPHMFQCKLSSSSQSASWWHLSSRFLSASRGLTIAELLPRCSRYYIALHSSIGTAVLLPQHRGFGSVDGGFGLFGLLLLQILCCLWREYSWGGRIMEEVGCGYRTLQHSPGVPPDDEKFWLDTEVISSHCEGGGCWWC